MKYVRSGPVSQTRAIILNDQSADLYQAELAVNLPVKVKTYRCKLLKDARL